MNSSGLNKLIYSYLGFHSVKPNAATDAVISLCLEELERVSHFRFVYGYYGVPPEFLNKPPYLEYLKGSRGVILAVMTLGGEVDRRINFYSRTDAAKAVVFDACASAYLEKLSDEYQQGIGEDLSYRFCPGYGGSDISDIKYIFGLLKPEKAGIVLTETYYMLPAKSMAGIIAVGGTANKECGSCAVKQTCNYRKEGARCYLSGKK